MYRTGFDKITERISPSCLVNTLCYLPYMDCTSLYQFIPANMSQLKGNCKPSTPHSYVFCFSHAFMILCRLFSWIL